MKNTIIIIALISLMIPVVFLNAYNVTNPCTTNDPQTDCTGFFLDLSLNNRGGNTFPNLLLYIIKLFLGIVGILAIAMLIFGGFKYVTSAGDQELAESGKRTITNAIIGLVIVILSYTVVAVIGNALVNNNVGPSQTPPPAGQPAPPAPPVAPRPAPQGP